MKTIFKLVSFVTGSGLALGGCAIMSKEGGPGILMIGMGLVLVYGTFKI